MTTKPQQLQDLNMTNLTKHHFVFAMLCLILFVKTGFTQNSQTDSLKAILTGDGDESYKAFIAQEVTVTYFDTNPDSSIIYAKKAIERSVKIDDPEIHGQSLMDLVVAYIAATKPDSARMFIHEILPYFEKHQLERKISASYRNLAVVGELTNQPDTSLLYLQKAMDLLEPDPDSTLLGEILFSRSYAYQEKGYYELAATDALHAAKIFEALESSLDLAYVYQYLGVISDRTDNLEAAIAWEEKAIKHSIISESDRQLAHSYFNAGFYQDRLGNIDIAKSYYLAAYDHAVATEQTHAAMRVSYQLAESYNKKSALDSTLYWLSISETNALSFNDKYILGCVYRMKAKLALNRNSFNEAMLQLKNSESYLDNNPKPQEQIDAYNETAEILKQLNQHERSLLYLTKAQTIKDSLFTLRQFQKVEELNLIYQTEKKDAEIQLLNTQVALDQSKKKSLWGGLALLGTLACSIIYTLLQRAKKNKKIFEQEKRIESERRRNLEQELEFKKKELTAKALQLAGKNQFLNSLESEIQQLKSSVDKKVSKSSEKISRMINRDQTDDEDWNQFGQEFSSIHQDFLDRLVQEYGKFSKGELRLIALMKMNLSSKDMANILRITEDGIKKARYRLRKKMQLSSELDIQDFLLNY